MTSGAAIPTVSAATPSVSTASSPVTRSRPAVSRTPTIAEIETSIASLMPLAQSLQPLVDLSDSWDSYGAIRPTPTVLDFAWRLGSELIERGFPTPEIFPTRRGGIQFEWNLDPARLEWEVDPDLSGGVFIFDSNRTGEKIDGELPDDLELLGEVLSRLRRG